MRYTRRLKLCNWFILCPATLITDLGRSMHAWILEFHDSRCELGEGLFLSGAGDVAWVDINSKAIFWIESGALMCIPTRSRPSVIFNMTEKHIEFGAAEGICVVDKETGLERVKYPTPKSVAAGWRSNDGCKIGATYILGFMHDMDPAAHPGYIFEVSGGVWSLLDDQVHIPNTFVRLSDHRLLVSDSLTRDIYSFEVRGSVAAPKVVNKAIWCRFAGGEPDGGCWVGNSIAIASWDAGSIEILSPDGIHERTLTVPFPRPTNCKFDPVAGKLWVTSASVGLEPALLKKFPMSDGTSALDFEGQG